METVKYTITKADWISTLRNWAILNGVMLLAYFNTIRDMFVNWNFNLVELREILFISSFSLVAFFLKRFFIGKKQ